MKTATKQGSKTASDVITYDWGSSQGTVRVRNGAGANYSSDFLHLHLPLTPFVLFLFDVAMIGSPIYHLNFPSNVPPMQTSLMAGANGYGRWYPSSYMASPVHSSHSPSTELH